MAKGHVEVHDPISNHSDLKSIAHSDATPTSDTENMEDTVEFKILMAYAKRRRVEKEPKSPEEDAPVVLNGHAPQSPRQSETDVTEKKKGKKKVWKNLRRLLSCVKPQTPDNEPQPTDDMSHDPLNRCGSCNDKPEEKDDLVASRLMKIASEIPFTPPDLETDSPDDDVERIIGLLLRESGDRLNDKMEKDIAATRDLFWNYSFFRTVMSALLTRLGLSSPNPESPGPHASPKTQIAVTCEATSHLSAMDTMPTSRLLGYGAQYLSEFYSSWVQEQGGYDAAFESDDEDDVQ